MIKALTVIMFVLLPVSAFSQNFQNMNKQDMQKIMQQALKAQACMEKIDQAALKELEQRGNEFDAEIKKLCAAGKRDKAQKKAISFSREFAKTPVLQDMKKCNEMIQGAMPGMMPEEELTDREYEESGQHICDE